MINYFRFKCKSYHNEKKNILNANLFYSLFEKWHNAYVYTRSLEFNWTQLQLDSFLKEYTLFSWNVLNIGNSVLSYYWDMLRPCPIFWGCSASIRIKSMSPKIDLAILLKKKPHIFFQLGLQKTIVIFRH